MSEYERNKGTLVKVCAVPDLTEEVAKSMINAELPSWCKNYIDMFEDCESYGYAMIDGFIWALTRDETVDNDPEYCNVTKNEDGSISFESYHHNGGAHWTELLEGKLL